MWAFALAWSWNREVPPDSFGGGSQIFQTKPGSWLIESGGARQGIRRFPPVVSHSLKGFSLTPTCFASL
jgi:hypothetical protein